MPPKSEKQRRFAYAAKAGDIPGVTPATAKKILGEGEKAPIRKTVKKSSKKSAKKQNSK